MRGCEIVTGSALPMGRHEHAIAGFTSAATWLVFSGLVIGVAIQHTGLAGSVADRIPSVGRRRLPRVEPYLSDYGGGEHPAVVAARLSLLAIAGLGLSGTCQTIDPISADPAPHVGVSPPLSRRTDRAIIAIRVFHTKTYYKNPQYGILNPRPIRQVVQPDNARGAPCPRIQGYVPISSRVRPTDRHHGAGGRIAER